MSPTTKAGPRGNEPYFVYREPESVEELKSLLLLRYSVDRGSRLRHLAPQSEHGISLDPFDIRSMHFGLLEHTEAGARPVGYIRMVTDTDGPWAGPIRDIVKDVKELAPSVKHIPKQPFPVMEQLPDPGALTLLYQRSKDRGERFVEAGRLSLDQSVRSLGLSGQLRFSNHMIAATYAVCMVTDVKKAVFNASASHKTFYRRFGFASIPGVPDWYWEEAGENRCCLLGVPETLPEPLRDSVLLMAETYRLTGRICFHPSAPDQYFAPTGSFVVSRPALRAESDRSPSRPLSRP